MIWRCRPHGFASASSSTFATNRSRWRFGGTRRLCVLRCWPTSWYNHRSDTAITFGTCSIARHGRPSSNHSLVITPLGDLLQEMDAHCWTTTNRLSLTFSFSRFFSRFTASRSSTPCTPHASGAASPRTPQVEAQHR